MEQQFRKLTTKEKALRLNLDTKIYGSFSEIGAGQEVANNFFKAGASSGTIAHTQSAYDMKISDSIYGACDRYVTEQRLLTMLDIEYNQVTEKLEHRKADSTFFAFCNTIEALNYHKSNQGHGWIGIKFQLVPDAEPNEVVIHINLKDNDNILQQHAIGIIGVNLIYGCFHFPNDPDQIMHSLVDELHSSRVEIDIIRFRGPDLRDVDNRLMSLKLVKSGLSEATLFGADGNVLQPSHELYKKNIMVLRGRFRPVTHVNMDMLSKGLEQFSQETDVEPENIRVLFELTLKDLSAEGGEISNKDFLDRVDLLSSLGHMVLISNYQKYYKLTEYLANINRNRKIGITLGIHNLHQIFEDKNQYFRLTGGLLESMGILFGRNVKCFVYPSATTGGEGLYTFEDFKVNELMSHLVTYLKMSGKITGIENANESILDIYSDDVLRKIKEGESGWEEKIPTAAVKLIKEKGLFDYKTQAGISAD